MSYDRTNKQRLRLNIQFFFTEHDSSKTIWKLALFFEFIWGIPLITSFHTYDSWNNIYKFLLVLWFSKCGLPFLCSQYYTGDIKNLVWISILLNKTKIVEIWREAPKKNRQLFQKLVTVQPLMVFYSIKGLKKRQQYSR